MEGSQKNPFLVILKYFLTPYLTHFLTPSRSRSTSLLFLYILILYDNCVW